jgi:TPR repeat protein
MIRGARAGDAQCQLALGKLYLFGGASLPQSLPTALHWLHRAAVQGRDEAWRLIGSHVGYEHAQHSREAVLPWYERAWEAGALPAGLVLAQLVLLGPIGEAAALGAAGALGVAAAAKAALRAKAMQALEAAARAGLPEALRLQALQHPAPAPGAGQAERAAPAPDAAAPGSAPHSPPFPPGAGLPYAALDAAWEQLSRSAYLEQALPLARQLLQHAPPDAEAARAGGWQAAPQQVLLLSRCAQALAELLDAGGRAAPVQDIEADETALRCRELAAHGGDRTAQLALGLWFARMNSDGERIHGGIAAVNFKRAIRWLTQAGEQGLADAWFALSRIYIKPEFSQRSVSEAQACLERAADMGHSAAQLECGIHAWRTRRGDEESDVRAAYWLQKAAGQGSAEAQGALRRIAPETGGVCWAAGLPPVSRELQASQPLLAARIELAGLFGLTRAEALLLDVKAADRGHCLVVDIRASYGRSKRRLVLVHNAQQRQALDRVARLFDRLDTGLAGPEGNYRQRLYRLKTWLPDDGGAESLLPA